jgi:hypothetical protein
VRIVVLSLLAVSLLFTAGAVAARKPTAAESKALRSVITGFVAMHSSPAAKDNKIVAITVSTADPRYADAHLNSKTVGYSELVLHRSFGTWWVLEFGSSLGCDTAPKSVMKDLKVGCSPPNGVAWINNCGPLASAPSTLVLACADANYELVKVAWHKWGAATATASATARANDCTPTCVAGHFHNYRVTVSADRLKTCGKARYYARLTLAYPGARPAGIAKLDVHTLVC